MSKEVVITFKPFHLNDLDTVCEIEQKVFSDPWSRQAFLDCARWPEFWFYVCCVGEKVVGYFVAQVVGVEAELHNIALHPDFQNRGIGKKLLAFFLQMGSEAQVQDVFLMTRVSNATAIKLYQHFGFGVIDRRKKYYKDNQEDALIFYLRMPKINPAC